MISNAQYGQAGNYNVTVSNPWGSVASSTVYLTVTVPPGSNLPLMQDLVVHLNFDGDLIDTSGRGNHATPVGSPNLVQGFIGSGGFNPFTQSGINNFATLGKPSDLRFGSGTDFTIAFWARLPTNAWTGTLADPPFISNKDFSSGDNTGWAVATGDDARLQWNYTESGSNPRKDYDGPGGRFGNLTWQHVAVSFQRGGSAITYINGLKVNTKSISPGGDFAREIGGHLVSDQCRK